MLIELRKQCVGTETPLPAVLRQLLVLGEQVKSEKLVTWARFELNGYPQAENLPTYRRLSAAVYGYIDLGFGRSLPRYAMQPSMFPEKVREKLYEYDAREPVASYTNHLDNTPKDAFTLLPNPDLVVLVNKKIDGSCIKLWLEVSPGTVAGMIDTIRNKALDLVLEVQRIAPEIEEKPGAPQPIPGAKVDQLVQNIFYGNGLTLIQTPEAKVEVTIQAVAGGGEVAVQKVLEEIGVPGAETTEYVEGLREAKQAPGGESPKLKGATRRIIEVAGKGLLKFSAEVVTKFLAQVTVGYLSLHK